MAVAGALNQSALAQEVKAEAETPQAARVFNIPAMPLAAALKRFGLEAGILLSFSTDLTNGLQSKGLNGNYAPATALRVLLAGTGLDAVKQSNGGYLLMKRPEPIAAARPLAEAMLPVVEVKADAERETATGPVNGYLAKRNSTGMKTDTPVREIPQSISVVTRDSLDARGSSSLAEVLEYAPGFTGQVYGQDNRYDWSIARGIGDTYGTNFRDGLKDAGFGYAIPRLSTYGVERVEYLRGPASLLFGSNIPGGAINSISKRPTQEAQGELRLRAGNNKRLGVAVDVSGPLDKDGDVLYRLVAQQEKHQLATPGAAKEERYFAPSLTFRLNADTQLTLLASLGRNRIDGDPYPYSYPEAVVSDYIQVAEKGWDRFDGDQDALGYVFDHRVSDSLSFHSRGRYSKVKVDYRVNLPQSLVSSTVIDRYSQRIDNNAKVWQTDNYLETQWGFNGWANTAIAGVDVMKVSGSQYRGGTSSLYDSVAGRGIGSFVEPTLAPSYISGNRQLGIYAQNQTKINDSFVVLLGGRKDWYREEDTTTAPSVLERSEAFTGRVGGVWLAPGGWSPYVSYSTSFQPQSGTSFNGSRFKPTTGRQYEIGVRYEPPGMNAMFSAALFDILQQNVLTTDPSNPNFSVQRGEVGSRGLELEANASLARGLDLTASYSYTDAKVTKDINPALVGRKNGLVAAHKAAVWLNQRLSEGVLQGVKVGLGVRYSGQVPDYENTRWVPSALLVDARLGYQLDAYWELALNARNLFDKKYLVNCSYGSCYPGERREVLGTATYRW